MLNILAKNPVFASNPACLADFVKSLVATSAQAIPTPMHKPAGEPDPTPTTPSAAAAPAMAVQHNTGGRDEVESSKAVEARKQFWSKFKRPSSSSSQDAGLSPRSEALLSLPTLRLGEEVPDEKESIEVIGSQELTPQMAEPVVPHCGPIPDTVLPDSQAASPCMANAVVHLEDPEPASEGPGKDGEPVNPKALQTEPSGCTGPQPAAEDLGKDGEPVNPKALQMEPSGCTRPQPAAEDPGKDGEPVNLKALQMEPSGCTRPQPAAEDPGKDGEPVNPEALQMEPSDRTGPEPAAEGPGKDGEPVNPKALQMEPSGCTGPQPAASLMEPMMPASHCLNNVVVHLDDPGSDGETVNPKALPMEPSDCTTPQPAVPAVEQMAPLPDSQPDSMMVDSEPEKPSTDPAGSNSVAEALKRVNTVDLENGKTPAPPQSLIAPASVGVSTVVLLDVGGVVQPVTVPLSPHQCKLAGLTLANEGSDPIPPPPGLNQSPAVPPPALMPPPSTVPRGSAQSAAPTTHASTELDDQTSEAETLPEPSLAGDDDGSGELSSKQMLRNMYMRFSRSQKRSQVALVEMNRNQ